MKILDNINHTVREDLQDTMQKGSRISIAAACFSIYAYQELKKQLEDIAELRFIFTSPTFVQENTPKERREFYIPKLTREKSLYGTEFEVRLRNELTQKALAKECADWVRRKVKFRSNASGEQMPGFMTVGESSYMPISGFTTVDLGCERGNNAYYPVQRTEAFENGRYFLSLFDEIWNDSSRLQDVTDIVLQSISTAYRENSPDFIYFFTLYNIFSEFLEDVSEDNLPNEATGFKQSKIWNMLYDFQRDAALAIIHKLEQYNGCILADSVGLGKTFTALAVIKYYENRNKSVLVLCPKKLAANWNIYKGNYVNNPLVEDRFRYDVLYHTDLSRVDQQNRLHPFYMVYIGQDGSTVCDYLSPKELLDRLRLLCKGKTEPDQSLCQQFNQATDDGKNMSAYSELLSEAINSILDAKEESDIDSLFKMGGTTALLSSISGLDDFELICFLVVQ